ncbi:response regulator transcription factor [Elusimicrobiota bacterium]
MSAKVLIVEDEPHISQMLQDAFQLEGFDVEAAYDGDSAIEQARFGLPDAMMLDIGLPGKSGWEVLIYLKSDPSTSAIPIVILSALTQQEDIKKGLSLGAAKYLTKPCDPLQAVDTIKELLAM